MRKKTKRWKTKRWKWENKIEGELARNEKKSEKRLLNKKGERV